VVRSHPYPSANDQGAHAHRNGQLVWSHDGVVTVVTDVGTWVVPPHWAVWVPSWVTHDVRADAALTMHGVYVDPDHPSYPSDRCAAVAVAPLLRELILASRDVPTLYDADGPDGRLMAVLLDRLAALDAVPVVVPEPRDPLLVPIAVALAADPADPRTLADWGRVLGASDRTLRRRFHDDVGTSFQRWRQQVRLLAALRLLAAERPVRAVAWAVGYESVSAFVSAFRRTFGVTPGRYYGGGRG